MIRNWLKSLRQPVRGVAVVYLRRIADFVELSTPDSQLVDPQLDNVDIFGVDGSKDRCATTIIITITIPPDNLITTDEDDNDDGSNKNNSNYHYYSESNNVAGNQFQHHMKKRNKKNKKRYERRRRVWIKTQRALNSSASDIANSTNSSDYISSNKLNLPVPMPVAPFVYPAQIPSSNSDNEFDESGKSGMTVTVNRPVGLGINLNIPGAFDITDFTDIGDAPGVPVVPAVDLNASDPTTAAAAAVTATLTPTPTPAPTSGPTPAATAATVATAVPGLTLRPRSPPCTCWTCRRAASILPGPPPCSCAMCVKSAQMFAEWEVFHGPYFHTLARLPSPPPQPQPQPQSRSCPLERVSGMAAPWPALWEETVPIWSWAVLLGEESIWRHGRSNS